ncbi:MAG: hypothetical protein JO295_01370 [Verrucomicrobia bacterium]|nr:hypothetical protein [Verrucomicrobiota bacterium]
MNLRLTSPSVCVIDDERQDYEPILNALIQLGIGSVHIRGESEDQLPPQPFGGLRIVFADLHLAGQTGKGAASHAAHVFKRIVSPTSGPLLVVIWSKYAGDPVATPDLPPEDQPTEADLFKAAVLEAEARFNERLIFVEMPKPKLLDRPTVEAWIETLKADFTKALLGFEACEFLWSWEALVRDAVVSVIEELTSLAVATSPLDANQFASELKLILRLLAKEQGGPDCSPATAPRHLAAVLAQSVADTLESPAGLETLADHGKWIADANGLPGVHAFAPKLNGMLLTSAVGPGGRAFMPGTVYRITDAAKFKDIFDELPRDLQRACYNKLEEAAWTRDEWEQQTVPVFVEISPVCDFHQGTRRQSLLVAGLIGPIAGREHARFGEGHHTLPPTIFLRWPTENFPQQDVFLIFCSRYKATLPHRQEPNWLVPWFRLRELPTASLRNWHASHSARVGFVSLR